MLLNLEIYEMRNRRNQEGRNDIACPPMPKTLHQCCHRRVRFWFWEVAWGSLSLQFHRRPSDFEALLISDVFLWSRCLSVNL